MISSLGKVENEGYELVVVLVVVGTNECGCISAAVLRTLMTTLVSSNLAALQPTTLFFITTGAPFYSFSVFSNRFEISSFPGLVMSSHCRYFFDEFLLKKKNIKYGERKVPLLNDCPYGNGSREGSFILFFENIQRRAVDARTSIKRNTTNSPGFFVSNKNI